MTSSSGPSTFLKAPGSFRRTRAETFSAFPTDLLDVVSSDIPSTTRSSTPMDSLLNPSSASGSPLATNRTRAGSLTLPKPSGFNGSASVFGSPDLVRAAWSSMGEGTSSPRSEKGFSLSNTPPPNHPNNSMISNNGNHSTNGFRPGPTGIPGSISHPSKLKTSFDVETAADMSNITRTLDYLGIDDYSPQRPNPPTLQHHSQHSSNYHSHLQQTQSHIQVLPQQQQLYLGGGGGGLIAAAAGNRMRAHSSVGGNAPEFGMGRQAMGNGSMNIPKSSGVLTAGRPRATTIGIVDRFVVDGVDLYGLMGQQAKQQSNQMQFNIDDSDQDQDFQTPSRSLWVGNLDATITAPEILSLFSPFGAIESLRMLPDKECVFVNFVRVEDALAAKDGMAGRKIGSSVVRLGFGKNEAVGDTQGMQPTKSVWIGNIPPSITSSDLEKMFSAFGPVESCRVLTHKSCGFVNFDSLHDAMKAQHAMNGQEIHGMIIKVGFAKVPSKTDGLQISTGGSQSVAGSYSAHPISPPKGGRTVLISGSGGAGGEVFLGSNDGATDASDGHAYAASLIALPEPDPFRKVDQTRLRDMRKRLENPMVDTDEVMGIFAECFDESVELCTDYIGNVVLQKLVDKVDESHRALLIEKLSKYLASLGVHKNGTWVVQKAIDSARTTTEAALIVKALRPYAPCLLLDQFGNYVIQCCLRLGAQGNQFIFDAIQHKCIDIATGRFGSRAMRSCLESQYTTKRQQKQVAVAITQHALQLVTNMNGNIIVAWLLDTSSLPGRYRVLAPKLAPEVPALCRHKLASATILKLVNQRIELDARDMILQEIFFRETDDSSGTSNNLRDIISDHTQGVSMIQKILAAGCVSPEERVRCGDRVRTCLAHMVEVKTNPMAYKRLLDEVAAIPSGLYSGGRGDGDGGGDGYGDSDAGGRQDVVSPLTPNVGFFSQPLPGEAGGDHGAYYSPQIQQQQQQQLYNSGYAMHLQGGYPVQQQFYGAYPSQAGMYTQQQHQGQYNPQQQYGGDPRYN
ncbi:hypothetical protein HDU80_001680 [Chytriomyces hyalinus]|nr:hypothetical protein HDU80_001680 [Chytriomyces hyalinus]